MHRHKLGLRLQTTHGGCNQCLTACTRTLAASSDASKTNYTHDETSPVIGGRHTTVTLML